MITHVLKDGRQLNSVQGIVIKCDLFPQVYRVIEKIEERGTTDETITGAEKMNQLGADV